jgi:signal recognition particle GTPase
LSLTGWNIPTPNIPQEEEAMELMKKIDAATFNYEDFLKQTKMVRP